MILLCQQTETSIWLWGGWTAVAAIGTLLSVSVAVLYTIFTYKLLNKTGKTLETANKVAAFNTYSDIKKALDTQQVQEMVEACYNNNILIASAPPSQLEERKIFFSNSVVKRHLIDVLEDVASYFRDGLIDIEKINYAYGYMILYVGNNQAIVDYIKKMRLEANYDELYLGFEELYQRIREESGNEIKEAYRKDFK